jgi:hypothetical protein
MIRSVLLMVAGLLVYCFPVDAKPMVSDTIPLPASIQLFEALPYFYPWLTTSNSAAINDIEVPGFNYFQINAGQKNNVIRYSHQPRTTTSYVVETSGLKKIKKASFLGTFRYTNEIYRDLKYNSTLNFDTWNPYIIGDTIPGVQNKEQFDLNATGGFKVFKKLSFSLCADYSSATGAKQKDPRNLNTLTSLALRPGFIYDFGSFKLGLSASAFNYSDKISISIEGNSYRRIFEFLGLGSYRSGVETSSYSNWYLCKGYEGSIQAYFERNNLKNIFDLTYRSSKEETRSGSNYRLLDGVTNNGFISVKDRLEIGGHHSYQVLDIAAELYQLSSDEYSQGLVNVNHFDEDGNVSYTTYAIKTYYSSFNKNIIRDILVQFNYRFIKFRESGLINYEAGGEIRFDYFTRGHYPIEDYGQISSANLIIELRFRKTIPVGKVFISPVFEPMARLNINSGSDLPSKLPVYCFPGIISNDISAMSAQLFGGNLDIEVEKQLSKKFIRSFFIKSVASYYYSPDFNESASSNFSGRLALGFTF